MEESVAFVLPIILSRKPIKNRSLLTKLRNYLDLDSLDSGPETLKMNVEWPLKLKFTNLCIENKKFCSERALLGFRQSSEI